MTAETRRSATDTGRDTRRRETVRQQLDRWCGAARESVHDSVVVVGGHGVTSHTFAARLGRDPRFEGKVVLAGPPATENRRLEAGVSLRGRAADFLAHALDVSVDELVDAITPGRVPVATRQTVCMADDSEGEATFSKVGPWQNHRGRSDRPIVYGFRNSATVATLRRLARGVEVVADAPSTPDEARDLAPGRRPLIVDATRRGDLIGGRETSRWGIAAAQVPFRTLGDGPRHPLTERTALAPLVRRDRRIDVGYFTPYADALSPTATWYGILARPVDLRTEDGRRERELAILTDELLAIGDACGLDPVDLDDTLGRAWIPAPPWTAPAAGGPGESGVFDLRRACTPGIAAYYADGMTGSAVAGTAAAEAVVRGIDPDRAAAAALRLLRRWNRVWWFETVKIPWVADRLTRLSPPVALAWPHSTSIRHWASAA